MQTLAWIFASTFAVITLGFVAWATQTLRGSHPLDDDPWKDGWILWLLYLPIVCLMDVWTSNALIVVVAFGGALYLVATMLEYWVAGALALALCLALAYYCTAERIRSKRLDSVSRA
jgi:hypothetical protein